ncbi:hypothetical protein OC861_006899 [Tilletia horrida]|nr:hypothetical protein OC845_006877 [Tilletia horrida]KAK0558488.1 hypothetical protein OC861_006899 [Tilletia horrida]
MRAGLNMIQSHNTAYGASARGYAQPVDAGMEREYAFELAASSIRYGEGVTREVGMDFKNMKATKVGVFTDSSVRKLTLEFSYREAIPSEFLAAVLTLAR